MPTGVALRDARARLFAAAERVLTDTDARTLAMTLIGTGHMLFAGELGARAPILSSLLGCARRWSCIWSSPAKVALT
jgi:hypothetical protein